MIIQLPDSGLSKSKQMRCKSWIKRLDRVDASQSNGYAFIGDFAQFRATVEVDDGTWYLAYVEDTSGSGRLYGRDITLYQVRGDQLVTVEEFRVDGEAGWALQVRDKIAAHLTAAVEPDVDALLAERERLLARVAEIDAQLPEPEGTEATTREAAAALGVSIRTVQRWAQTGRVDAEKRDGRWVVTITL